DGAKIIVMAWATRKDTATVEAAIEMAEKAGVLVVTGAGDRGEDLAMNPTFPAQYSQRPNVISVAALDQAGGLSQSLGRYSNFGAQYVDIAAPGDNLKVLRPQKWLTNHRETITRGGSDLAAAHVAGVAALVAAKHPEYTADQLKGAVLGGALVDARLAN